MCHLISFSFYVLLTVTLFYFTGDLKSGKEIDANCVANFIVVAELSEGEHRKLSNTENACYFVIAGKAAVLALHHRVDKLRFTGISANAEIFHFVIEYTKLFRLDIEQTAR